jgi:hypothetical protein
MTDTVLERISCRDRYLTGFTIYARVIALIARSSPGKSLESASSKGSSGTEPIEI